MIYLWKVEIKDKSILFKLFCCFIPILILLIGFLFIHVREGKNRRCVKPVPAVITSVIRDDENYNAASISYKYSYKNITYTYNSFFSSTAYGHYNEGDTIQIYINPDNPNEQVLNKSNGFGKYIVYVGILMLVIYCGVDIYLLVETIKEKRKKKESGDDYDTPRSNSEI